MYILVIHLPPVPRMEISPSDLLTFATVSWTETQEDEANERQEGHPRPNGGLRVEFENENLLQEDFRLELKTIDPKD